MVSLGSSWLSWFGLSHLVSDCLSACSCIAAQLVKVSCSCLVVACLFHKDMGAACQQMYHSDTSEEPIRNDGAA